VLEIFTTLIVDFFKAILRGGRRIRSLASIAAVLLIIAIIGATFAVNLPNHSTWLKTLAGTLGAIAGAIVLAIASYERAFTVREREKVINRVEERVREHPNEPQAAWDLARIKLESYLNRNLMQIYWIFFLTLLVMLVGFIIIGYGVIRVYQSPDNFRPSIVVTVSGVVVEFIAATFLLIYRSTMEQAKEYVNILERINAVGMSVQILDNVEGNDPGLRDKTRAEIAMELLKLYGSVKNK
jgi:glucan phosphoethanolaminetransferase (alkaline phosphatase superfamily)